MDPTHDAPHVLIVTGMSGAGRSTAANILEDLEYVVIDNLPPSLLDSAVKAHDIPEQHRHLAVVIDSRSGLPLEQLKLALMALGRDNIITKIVFLDADDDVIIKRYEENRRPHPLGGDTIVDAITAERKMTEPLKEMADVVIDTSGLNVHQLREHMTTMFSEQETPRPMRVSIRSFGYKHGAPRDADLLFDVRFVPNPHWVPELRPLRGTDADVRSMSSKPKGPPSSSTGRRAARFPHPAVRGGVEVIPHHRNRLHGWASPVGGDRRGAGRKAATSRCEGVGPPPGHRQVTTQPETDLAPLLLAPNGPTVVALGGGHGQAAALEAIQTYAGQITALVTVADNGGSSGRLTRLGIPPPGDIRRCLLALTPEPSLWSELFAYRFEGGDLHDHSLGNLILVGLTDMFGDFPTAVETAGRMLGAMGRVVPVADRPVTLRAVVDGTEVVGQLAIARSRGTITDLSDRAQRHCSLPAGVGSGRRSPTDRDGAGQPLHIGHLGPEGPDAGSRVQASEAQRVFVLNLVTQDGETMEMSGADHLEALRLHAAWKGRGWWWSTTARSTSPMVTRRSPSIPTTPPDTAGGWWRPTSPTEADWPAHDPIKLGKVLEGLSEGME
jgi:RNase adapter protein RapZ